MPLVTIESFSPRAPKTIPSLLADVQKKGAEALECPLSNLWVIFRAIPSENYLHDPAVAELSRGDTYPPVVTIKAQSGRSPAQKEKLVKAIASAIAHKLGTSPENIWIHYDEMNPNDVWFKGRWASDKRS